MLYIPGRADIFDKKIVLLKRALISWKDQLLGKYFHHKRFDFHLRVWSQTLVKVNKNIWIILMAQKTLCVQYWNCANKKEVLVTLLYMTICLRFRFTSRLSCVTWFKLHQYCNSNLDWLLCHKLHWNLRSIIEKMIEISKTFLPGRADTVLVTQRRIGSENSQKMGNAVFQIDWGVWDKFNASIDWKRVESHQNLKYPKTSADTVQSQTVLATPIQHPF